MDEINSLKKMVAQLVEKNIELEQRMKKVESCFVKMEEYIMTVFDNLKDLVT